MSENKHEILAGDIAYLLTEDGLPAEFVGGSFHLSMVETEIDGETYLIQVSKLEEL